jgi:hypothetical protein
MIKKDKIEAEHVEQGEIEAAVETFDLDVYVHTVDKERQKITFRNITFDDVNNVQATIISALDAMARSKALSLATPDGCIYIFNVDNVTCVELRR